MNAMKLAMQYADQIAAIAEAMVRKDEASKSASEASKANTSTLTDMVRDFAVQTAADGIPAEDGRKALIFGLTGLEAPKGSVKASGNHFAGYRAMIADGVEVADKSVKDAQAYIASDDVKAINAIKAAWAEARKAANGGKGWKLADWQAFAEREGIKLTTATIETREVTDDEADAIHAEARAA